MLQPEKPAVKCDSLPERNPKEQPETGPDTLPGGAALDAELQSLAAAAAEDGPPDYGHFHDMVCEVPESWGGLTAGERQGAVQVAWYLYVANSYRLSGYGTEYRTALALGWQDDECRAWLRAQMALDFWDKERRADFDLAMAPAVVEADKASGGGLPLIYPAGRQPKGMLWHVPGLVAEGHLSIIVGEANIGKSTMVRRLCADVVSGRRESIPNFLKDDKDPDFARPGKLLWVTAEEDADTAIIPSFNAAGMPPDGYAILDTADTPWSMGEVGLERLKSAAAAGDYRLVVLDGGDGFLPEGVNPNTGADVRKLLHPWRKWSKESGVAVILLRHEGKAQRRAGIQVGTGSAQWLACVRLAAWLDKQAQKEGENEGLLLLMPQKTNAGRADTWSLCIDPVWQEVMTPQGVKEKPFGRTRFLRPELKTADGHVADKNRGPGRPDEKLTAAREFLEAALVDGPKAERELNAKAKDAGITRDTLRRAKGTDKGLGVVEFESCGVTMLRMPTESDIASRARGILRNSAQNSETVGNIDKNPAQNYAQNPAQNSESDNFAHLESGAADCAKPLPCAKLEGNFAQDFAHHETVVNNGLPAPAQNCAKLLPLARAPEVLPCGHAVGYVFDGACDGACMVNGCEGKGD